MTNLSPAAQAVQQWGHDANLSGVPYDDEILHWEYEQYIAARAAQYGADQELEACCIELTEKIITNSFYEGDKTECSWRELASIVVRKLRAARRPKPPSLKQQALDRCNDYIDPDGIIRRALEALDD
jgi:hypothetical protein